MIAVIDYGMGNLRSVQKAFEKAGANALITQKKEDIANCEHIVLPGVGAIQPAIEKLQSLDLIDAIKKCIDERKPFLGICLGYQLLFDKSDEGGNVKGLGILPGSVKRFSDELKVPHMGWNQLNMRDMNCPLYKGINDKANVYFCHSYYVAPDPSELAATTTDYGIDFVSSIASENIFGVQFHPEKSQEVGLSILKNFMEIRS